MPSLRTCFKRMARSANLCGNIVLCVWFSNVCFVSSQVHESCSPHEASRRARLCAAAAASSRRPSLLLCPRLSPGMGCRLCPSTSLNARPRPSGGGCGLVSGPAVTPLLDGPCRASPEVADEMLELDVKRQHPHLPVAESWQARPR